MQHPLTPPQISPVSNFQNAELLYQQLRSFLTQQAAATAASSPLLAIGVHAGGAWLVQRLALDLGPDRLLGGSINASLHRDDFAQRGLARAQAATDLPFAVEGADVWIIDDVLHSGRTLRAVLNELFDFGRPARVRLAVLVDRGERQLPFAADYAALRCSLAADQRLTLVCAAHDAAQQATQFRFDTEASR